LYEWKRYNTRTPPIKNETSLRHRVGFLKKMKWLTSNGPFGCSSGLLFLKFGGKYCEHHLVYSDHRLQIMIEIVKKIKSIHCWGLQRWARQT